MMQKYTVSLEKIIKDHKFDMLYMPKAASDIYVSSADVNRPGMFLCGYEEYFDSDRIQFIGLTELEYIKSLPVDEGVRKFDRLLEKQPVCVIITRGLELPEEYIELAKKHEVPMLVTLDQTSRCMSTIISYLNVELAPRVTRHGVLLEVSGEGVLILGDSGVGKSETALELIKRGHRLIADDAVEIRRVSEKTLVGSAPDNIRHYIELRGVGIINARRIFGMGAVKAENEINLVVNIVPWKEHEAYDRLGLEEQHVEILGVQVPMYTIPITPGRNLAVILEVAAMNNRQKKMGYNPAKEFTEQMDSHFKQNIL